MTCILHFCACNMMLLFPVSFVSNCTYNILLFYLLCCLFFNFNSRTADKLSYLYLHKRQISRWMVVSSAKKWRGGTRHVKISRRISIRNIRRGFQRTKILSYDEQFHIWDNCKLDLKIIKNSFKVFFISDVWLEIGSIAIIISVTCVSFNVVLSRSPCVWFC